MIEPRKVLLTLLVIGLVGSLVAFSALSAFSATTENPANEFAAGTVHISDNDAGTAMYDVDAAEPGTQVERCIKVTYGGTLNADVKLYTASSLGSLAPYVDLTITPGTQASSTFPDCTGFVADASAIYTGTLAGFATAHSGWANGLADNPGAASAWTTGDAVVYRFTLTLQDDNGANGGSGAALTTGVHAFTWEARNQ